MINGIGHVVGFANRPETFVRPQSVDVDTGIRRHQGRGGLIDVCLPLQVQTATPHVAHTQKRFPEQLALHSNIPVPRFRVLERLTLRGHHEWDRIGPAASRIIHRAKRNAGIGLERRIATEKNGVADAQTGKESSAARAQHGIFIV